MSRFKGKIAVVTASTYGIGFAIARRLAREGARVIISSRKEKNVLNAVEELKKEGLDVTGVVCHVSNPEHRKKLFETSERLGGLDILVSNAAVNPEVTNLFNATEPAWDKIFDVNVKAAFLLAKEALPQLKKSHSGRIVFISSIIGFTSSKVVSVYAISKTALIGLTKAAATDLGEYNITVNCVAPGLIKTRFAEVLIGDRKYADFTLGVTPLNRFGEVDEISGVVAFLCSQDASYITGEAIVAAGGAHARL